MTFQVPNPFVPQTGQPISSSQVDQNNDYLTEALNTLQAGQGGTGGDRIVNTHDIYTFRPTYNGVQAPTGTDFVDFKYLMACRGCQIGDAVWSLNPNALPNDYGIVWAELVGQQLSKTTYAAFYALMQSIGGTNTGRYNPDASGAAAGNYFAPDLRGAVAAQILGSGNALPSTVPNVVAANWLGSVVGEGQHTQTAAEVGKHTHATTATQFAIFDPGTGRGGLQTDSPGAIISQENAGGSPFNIVQKTSIHKVWYRIA